MMNREKGQAPTPIKDEQINLPNSSSYARGNPQLVSGQAMLLTVMLLTGVILSTTSLVALITLYQIRQTTDVTASTQAIFAADAGIECALFRQVKDGSPSEWGDCSQGTLSNGAEFRTVTEGGTIKSAGKSRRSARAFEASF